MSIKDKDIKKIIALLNKKYPNPKSELNYRNALQLLIAVILSARCTDVQVNKVTTELFKHYKSADDYAKANIKDLEKIIKPLGFYRNKAKNLKKTGQILIEKFNGKVPSTIKELTQLAGVARKTANVVMAEYFKKAEGFAVDTHVARVAQRLALTKNSNPLKIEQDLIKKIPKKNWINTSLQLVLHGRYICKARTFEAPPGPPIVAA